ncbi:PQQ-binding-like beta-propeller repeat protein [Lacipirellula parvula]|uniref:Putative serine/threonine protein kinase related protein n=1 Tax=Lacipirellula parvula TaxID=2650471 RepID=A0A5K7X604_9BACT|nr:PQQ-binding-like beta-propeller repeat protein [Lacipirellula parvula]BBO31928.1 putative serine/threonine protein kinase related protein [Lacipirellula parvula]
MRHIAFDKYRSPRDRSIGFLCALANIAAACMWTATATAADWPQWQGADRNAMSAEQGLLQEWPEGGPPLAWRVDNLGGGDSAPAIAAGRLYGMSARDGEEIVWALNEADGKVAWEQAIGPAVEQRMPQSKEGPGGTPTVDGELLYVIGMGGELACLRAADGTIVWHRNLVDDFGGTTPMWSFRESPLIDGDRLICTPGGEDATLVALNKLTGETIWKSQAPGSPKAAYSSPIAIDFEGQRQYVQLTAQALIGVAASDGAFLWEYAKPANRNGINCTTPLYHDGTVFAASAYGAGGGLAKLSKGSNDEIEAEEVYFTNRMQNHHGGIILFEGCLYGANGGNGGGNLICLDFENGDVLWDERRGETRVGKGSIAFADGRLYYRTEDGTMLLIQPNAEKYVEVGRFDPPDRTNVPAWAHPVIANGKLYVRDQDVLLCYDIAKK